MKLKHNCFNIVSFNKPQTKHLKEVYSVKKVKRRKGREVLGGRESF